MSIKRHVDEKTNLVTISVGGRFDFAQHKAFRDAYRDLPAQGTRYRVDLSEATYLDSSALGMLLLLREHAGGDTARVSLRGCSDDVRRVLKIANFDRLFTLE
ncbi:MULTISPECIES: STAS domain-containing protein [Ectothiorhodospira]|uniref:Anti-anti-sigma factor n=1 Tax=Ectothiorhodospira haloalkaliphila TaxID=421628 RepID=W8KGP8_9GAMM|nr:MULTISPECIES: STAS domain-containing protein [Ectothiorhodospira]TVQ72781.1 MAG: anti-sigma factor antagonist [Chromatiaceae bacterium]AHK78974.1 anti-anti-sigma factor [Ectothiorhodospira haloalkaliphila]ANB03078.1 anti-anti-sigma factor [Ectothiorhodospira sp. BSL-9]MCG5493750.1 STAS domain-containing protein [Ectothiorhodospira variabilis]MCG5497841.1 STAS domain-containing protein [Ectothiorhodospira variabilis]